MKEEKGKGNGYYLQSLALLAQTRKISTINTKVNDENSDADDDRT